MEPHSFIFFGCSGSGKGTQAELLIKYLEEHDSRSVLFIETGKLLRSFFESGDSHTQNLTRQTLQEGGLMPAFMPVLMWGGYLAEHFSGGEHVVFDGVARRPEEAPILDAALTFYKVPKRFVLFLNVSHEWARERLRERARHDDGDAQITARLEWFDENTLPAIEYFREKGQGTFLEINGEQTIEETHQEILQKLGFK